MYDSVSVGEIPAHAPAVAGYVGGAWPTYRELERRFPHAHKLSVAISASEDADGLDIENGDATVAEAPAWYRRQKMRGHPKPTLYTSASNVGALVKAMRAAGVSRADYQIWSAHFTGVPHICDSHCTGGFNVEATQWTDKAQGRDLDESLCLDGFFGPFAAPRPPGPSMHVLTPLERREVSLFDMLEQHPHRHPVAVHKVRERLVQLRKEVWMAAAHDIKAGHTARQAWTYRDRGQRYAILQARTKGLG